ncbi:MAG: hypothetical protein A2Y10_14595 [Planctomycetes bacterium GWF2_41_51]|nr:MAG: hypothetical protein A2Y10_14595 [Planctomycetes bacterium GWF2_41_51]HBG25492.1 hypothetical protein [Phycisphaerales bacterium]
MSIRSKLIIVFLAVALTPTVLIQFVTYGRYEQSLKSAQIQHLQDVLEFKASQLETFFKSLKSDILITCDRYAIRQNIPEIDRLADEPNNPEYIKAGKIIDEQLKQMQAILNLSDIMIVNPKGTVIYAIRAAHHTFDMSIADPVQLEAIRKGREDVYFSDVYFDKAHDNRYEMLLTSPINDINNVFAGVIVFELDMAEVYNLIQEKTALGATGEALIGKKVGSEVVYLSPLKYDPDAVLKFTIDVGGEIAVPIQKGAAGQTGAGITLDYRGETVISAWKYLPSLDWGMVAKIDASEAFESAYDLKKLILVRIFVVFLLSILISYYISLYISHPIKKLAHGAQIIGSGDLDYKVAINQKDEIGRLSRVLDKMTSNLKNTLASRDDLNREITERKKAEETLRESEERYRSLFESIDEGFCIIQVIFDKNEKPVDYLFLSVNPAFERQTGIVNAVGKKMKDIAPMHEQHWFDTYGKVALTGESIRFENSAMQLGRHFDVYAFRIGLPEERKVAVLFKDITERKKAEQKMKELNEELKRSNTELEDFANIISHDLREPLRAVTAFMELLKMRYKDKLDDKANEFIDFAMSGGKSMKNMLNGLLEYSRVQTEGVKFSEVDVNDILQNAINNLQIKITETSAEITNNKLPKINCDPSQLTQLFQNLIQNAIKFKGNDNPKIHIGSKRQENGWLFYVRDNGIGIEQKYLERIFLIFHRVHARDKYEGTGVGLAVCKRIVERHRGKIWVESEPGKGATFFFTIPD